MKKIKSDSFLGKLITAIAWPALSDEDVHEFAEGGTLFDAMPAGVTISRIKNSHRYSGSYKTSKKVYGDSLLEVLQELQKIDAELDPLSLLYHRES